MAVELIIMQCFLLMLQAVVGDTTVPLMGPTEVLLPLQVRVEQYRPALLYAPETQADRLPFLVIQVRL